MHRYTTFAYPITGVLSVLAHVAGQLLRQLVLGDLVAVHPEVKIARRGFLAGAAQHVVL